MTRAEEPPTAPDPARSDRLAIHRFRATRYADPSRLAELTAPAYDLIDPAERDRLLASAAHNIVHLTLSPQGPEAARAQLDRWRRDGTFVVDPRPQLYLYELAESTRAGVAQATRGWIGVVDIGEEDSPAIRPHEATMPGPVAGRTALLAATRANLEPIVLAHDGEPGPAAELADAIATDREPAIDLTDDQDVHHRLWATDDTAELDLVEADLGARRAVIADGHHRYASYRAYRADQSHPSAPGGGRGPWDRGLALVIPSGAHGPRVEAIHRVVPRLDLDAALAAVGATFRVDRLDRAPEDVTGLLAVADRPTVLITDGTDWALLRDPKPAALLAGVPTEIARIWSDLDVALVDEGLIRARWGRDSADQNAVSVAHSVSDAVASARRSAGIAVLLRATPAAVVLAVAGAGVLMPRKSTLFVPKPRTGLVIRCLADDVAEAAG